MMRRSEVPSFIQRIIVAAIIVTPVFCHVYVNVMRAPPSQIAPSRPPYAMVMLGDPAEFKVGNLLFKVPRVFVDNAGVPLAAVGFVNGTPILSAVRFVARRLPDGRLVPLTEDQAASDDDIRWVVHHSERRTEIQQKLSPGFLANNVEDSATGRLRPGLTQYLGGSETTYYGVVRTERRTTEVMLRCAALGRHGCFGHIDYSVPIYVFIAFQYINLDHWDGIIRAVFGFMETYSTETQGN